MSHSGSKKALKPKKTASPQPKTVEVKVSTNGSCSPDPARVHSIDSIMWSGDVTELEFPNDHPFSDPTIKKYQPKQIHKVSKEKGRFKYNVTTSSGKYDPEVVVEPPPQ